MCIYIYHIPKHTQMQTCTKIDVYTCICTYVLIRIHRSLKAAPLCLSSATAASSAGPSNRRCLIIREMDSSHRGSRDQIFEASEPQIHHTVAMLGMWAIFGHGSLRGFHLRFLIPKAVIGMALGILDLTYWVLGPCGSVTQIKPRPGCRMKAAVMMSLGRTLGRNQCLRVQVPIH